HPHVVATRDGDGWRIDGTKTAVPAMHVAESVVVPCRTEGGQIVVLLVPANAPGITATRQQTTNHEPLFEVVFAGARIGDDAVLGSIESGREVLDYLLARTTVAMCAVASGVADEAIRITAQYTTERKQFDRAIGTFQAVGQRMADSFIDNQAI